MNRQQFITIMVTAGGTIAALVGLAAIFEVTRVPGVHYEIGWLVTLLGCGLMVWRLRANVVITLLASAAFLVVVRYVGFAVAYALLESGVLWTVFGAAALSVVVPTLAGFW